MNLKMFEEIKIIQQEITAPNTDFSLIHKKSVVDLSVKPKHPPLAISFGFDSQEYKGIKYPLRFGTYGNISMIAGEEKSRKTWLKSLILGCIQGGNSYRYSELIKGHDLEDKYIIDIDSEQDDYDAWMVANRVPQMVGGIDTPKYSDRFISVKLREYSSTERRQYLQWLFLESQYRNKLGVVCLDGYVDFIKNFNDNIESTEFVQELMKYSSISKSHIMGILHLNPNSEKARGHLGTVIGQKCESVLVIKDEGKFSSIKQTRRRGKAIEPFAISVDENWLPIQVNENLNEWL